MSIEQRKTFSENRLREVESELKNLETPEKLPKVCVYVCGSYGRKEANKSSDLDIFFVDYDTPSGNKTYNNIDKILFDADLITMLKRLNFPDLSNDGEYLEVHSFQKALNELGGREDDYHNYFTTRLLLLLESSPLLNKDMYKKIIEETIDAYFRDYPGHRDNFRPIFLLNDIMRFWKTLCLNYEYKRNETNLESEDEKAKHRLKNFKLKFSRKTICYSMIISLLNKENRISTKTEIIKLINLSPLERIEWVATKKSTKELYNELIDRYLWFLDEVERPDIKESLLDDEYKVKAFKKGEEFSNCIFRILKDVSDDETIERLVI